MEINAFIRGAGKAFGAIRTSTGDKSKAFAGKIGAGDSLWRMVESGKAHFNAAYALTFIQLCPEVSFQKFSVIHIICKILDLQEPENHAKCCEILTILEPKLKLAFEAYVNQELSEEERIQIISEQVRCFLTNRREEDFTRAHGLLEKDPTIIHDVRSLIEKIAAVKE